MDMGVVDSKINAQHRVSGCGQGRKKLKSSELLVKLSLFLSSDWDRRRSAEPRRIPITTPMYIKYVPWTRLRVLHVLQLQLIQKSIHTTSQFATRILSGPALRHIRQVKMVAKIQTGQQKSKIR